MAKINVEFDTKDKALEVTMDGKKIKDVIGVDFFNRFDGEGKFFAEIRTEKPNDDDGIIIVTRIMAEETTTTTESGVHNHKDGGKDKDKDKKKKADESKAHDDLLKEIACSLGFSEVK
jgi:hypothetical protein